MSKTTIPTRSHVLDMFHAGVRSGQPATARTQPDNPGYFDSGTATAIPPDEGHRILGLLRGIAQGGDLEVVKKLPNGAGRIRYRINCSKFVDLPTAQQRYRSAKAELWVTNARTGTSTPVVVVLRWANFGANCWLNVQANPTSLLTGTNAVAAGLNLGRRRERLYMFRYPYLVLQRLLRAVDAGFAWSEPTAQRLRTGDFSLHNVQVALYLPLGSREKLRRFLNWLYAVYCTPIVATGWRTYQLGRHLNLRAEAKLGDDGQPSGVMFWRYKDAAKHSLVTVNFYDKLSTLTPSEHEVLDAGMAGFLAENLRVDITLHQPMLDKLATEAGVASATTAAGFSSAVAALNARGKRGGGLGFDDWLIGETLGGYLRLTSLLRFRPEALEAAKAKLAAHSHLMAVWDEWTGIAGPSGNKDDGAEQRREWPDLRELLRACGIPESTVRTNLHAVRRAGLDPDIPPVVHHRLAMMSSIWGFDDADAVLYARALADGDFKALDGLMRRNREFLRSTRAGFRKLADKLSRPASVPVLQAKGDTGMLGFQLSSTAKPAIDLGI